MSNIIYEFLLEKLPYDKKMTPSGWMKFNGPCCIHNGERRPDSKQRAGIIVHNDVLTYNCLNCGFKAGWSQGKLLSKNMKQLFDWLGVSNDELKKIQFKLFQLKHVYDENKTNDTKIVLTKNNFNEISLPENSKPITECDLKTKDFIDTLMYLNSRGNDILTSGTYYYTSTATKECNFSRRIIIPFTYQDKIVGWTARAIDDKKRRYFTNSQPDFLFNNHLLYNYKRKYIILVEGPFDAIAVNGIATLGNKISKKQVEWLNSSNKEIIVMPDRDIAKSPLIEAAIDNNWYVSFPWTPYGVWDINIKDAAEASKTYGKLFTIKTIMDCKIKDRVGILTNYNYIISNKI